MTLTSLESGATRPDVAIVGAGLAGRLLAWRLAREGLRVALYERGDPHGRSAAAWVAAAMLAPLAEAAVAEPLLVALGEASLARWPVWLAELPAPVYFQRNGTLVVWHAADHADAALFQRRVAANAPASALDGRITPLDAAALAQAEPALGGRFRQGWLLDGEGQLDNRQLLAALDLALAGLGVPIHAGVAVDADNWPHAGVT
ncbi:MAG: FAD-dependent oxidoreductase, partial [Janthinobacterium lividum]